MKSQILSSKGLFALALGVLGAAAQAQVAYNLGVNVSYLNSATDTSGTYSPGPDTGVLTITNNGASSFTGTMSLTGLAGNGFVLNDTYTGTLGAGQTWTFLSGDEGSNQGGFNKVSSNPDLGALFSISGTMSLGASSAALSYGVYDSQIHSGVPRTDNYGFTTDAYILQGGDPFGYDNGDGYELTQASASFNLQAVPEPMSMSVLALGALGLIKRRK